jgi:DNA-binding response OmpR family regulator
MDCLAAAARLHPDLVLTDIMMPRMSGERMVAKMRERADLADTPVMVLSARADEPLRIRLLRG